MANVTQTRNLYGYKVCSVQKKLGFPGELRWTDQSGINHSLNSLEMLQRSTGLLTFRYKSYQTLCYDVPFLLCENNTKIRLLSYRVWTIGFIACQLYGLPKETVAAIMILYRNAKVKVRSPDGDTEYFDIVAGVLQGDTLAPYLFIICLDYVLRTSIDKIRENGFELTKRRSKRYPAKTITDADYADDLALLANTPNQAETLLHSLERAAAGIGLHVNANKTEHMCYNQTGNIATLDGASLKLVDKFTYLGSSVSSTEKDIDTRLTKAWTAIDRLSIIWKSDLTDKMKRSFFQAAVVSILLYGCTTWTLTKRLERRLDGNYTRMLRAVLNKSWRQHPTRLQLYGHLPPITKTIQVRRTRHARHCWRSKDELISDVLLWTPTHGCARVGRPARTYIQQLCEDTGCNPEDLPEAMSDREKWRETVRDIRAGGATWWWWWCQSQSIVFHLVYLIVYQLSRVI